MCDITVGNGALICMRNWCKKKKQYFNRVF